MNLHNAETRKKQYKQLNIFAHGSTYSGNDKNRKEDLVCEGFINWACNCVGIAEFDFFVILLYLLHTSLVCSSLKTTVKNDYSREISE